MVSQKDSCKCCDEEDVQKLVADHKSRKVAVSDDGTLGAGDVLEDGEVLECHLEGIPFY